MLRAETAEGLSEAVRVWEHTITLGDRLFDCLVVESRVAGGHFVKTWYCPTYPLKKVRVERDAVALAGLVEDRVQAGAVPGDPALERILGRYAAATDARVVVVGAGGKLLSDSDTARELGRDFSTRPEIATALGGAVATGTRRSDTLGETLLYVAVPVASGGRVFGAVRVSELATEYSHSAAERSLPQWLKDEGIPCIAGIDTRALTKRLRTRGCMLGKVVVTDDVGFDDPNQRNLVAEVSIGRRDHNHYWSWLRDVN